MENKNDVPLIPQNADIGATNTDDRVQEKQGDVKKSAPRLSPYERTRRAVYATGNKWAIENFHATHN
jgi:hypothetical protein